MSKHISGNIHGTPPARMRPTRCTVERHNGLFCDAPSAPDMPFPICAKHAIKLYRRMRDLIDAAPIADKRAIQNRPHQATYRDVVYYVQIGDVIKIGYTANFWQRMVSYPPHKRVLATEDGNHTLELKRHRQFAPFLQYGQEWFRPGEPLIRHINRLRARVGVPRVTGLTAGS